MSVFHEEIARQRQADLLREAAQERLARAARLHRAPVARVGWAPPVRLLHLRRAREVVAEPAQASVESA